MPFLRAFSVSDVESMSTSTALLLRHFREVSFKNKNKKLQYRKPKLGSSYYFATLRCFLYTPCEIKNNQRSRSDFDVTRLSDLFFVKLLMMSTAPAKFARNAGYASQNPFNQSTLFHTICLRRVFSFLILFCMAQR